MEIQPTTSSTSTSDQQKIDATREALESERKAADDSEIERAELERAADSRAATEEGVGEQVDIDA